MSIEFPRDEPDSVENEEGFSVDGDSNGIEIECDSKGAEDTDPAEKSLGLKDGKDEECSADKAAQENNRITDAEELVTPLLV